jgi:type II secretory pathway pseudopilin PulG
MIAMDSDLRVRAFSLIEVVIALGVAAAGLLVVLGILPGLIRQQAEARQAQIALALPDAIAIELRRHARGDPALLSSNAAEFSAESSSLHLVAASDGSDVRVLMGNEDSRREQYFLIEIHRFPPGSVLAAASNASFAALQARVSWPYRPAGPSGTEVPPESRQRITFNLALNR